MIYLLPYAAYGEWYNGEWHRKQFNKDAFWNRIWLWNGLYYNCSNGAFKTLKLAQDDADRVIKERFPMIYFIEDEQRFMEKLAALL